MTSRQRRPLFRNWLRNLLASCLSPRPTAPKSPLAFESLEGRSLMAFGAGDIAFTGLQGTSTDDLASFVTLKNIAPNDVLTITDDAWTGTAMRNSEGNSVITFQSAFPAGTQFNFASSRSTGSKWAVGSNTTGLADVTGGAFSLSAGGENLFAYNSNTPPTSDSDPDWVAALSTNPFLSTGSANSNTTYLPSALATNNASLSLGLASNLNNQNGAYTGGNATGTPQQLRATIHNPLSWTTFTTAGGQAIPPAATFTIQTSGNSSPNGIDLSNNQTLENASLGTTIGQFSTQDPDVGDTFTYDLVAGAGDDDNASFDIDGQHLIVNALLDFETKSSYSIRVQTTDFGGLTFARNFTIALANQNETLDLKLNEIKIAPPGTTSAGNQFQYVELRGTPGAALTNVSLVMLDGNQVSLGSANYVLNLTGHSLGSNGLLMIKSPTGGHSASAGTAVVTDPQFDLATGALSKQSASFFLVSSTAAWIQGTDYDSNNDGTLDNLPTSTAIFDTVGWTDGDANDRIYGFAPLPSLAAPIAAASRFVNQSSVSPSAWFYGNLVQTGSNPAQLQYEPTQSSPNMPAAPALPGLTPGDRNYEIPTGTSNLRVVSYNITSSGGTGSPRSGLSTILEAIGSEIVAGIARPIDLLAIQEVATQSTTSAAVAAMLNTLYGSPIYAYGSLNGDTTGAGTQGVVYNTQSLSLLNEVEIGSASSNGQPRTTIRHHFETVADGGMFEIYVYNSHWKSADDTDGRNRRRIEAENIRADADSLGQGAHILYVGDFNLYDSSESAYVEMLSSGNGQAFDPINRPGNWHGTNSFRDLFTQAPAINPPSGLTGGGLDDRFDFQLVSGEFLDGVGLDYRPGTYHVFGNNGSVSVNGNINDSTSTALSGFANRTTLLNLLTTVSDHLPVVADYQLPGGPVTPLPPTLSPATDLGALSTDHLTKEPRPEFTGLATPGNLIKILANDVVVAQGTVAANGTYSVRPPLPLAAGTYIVRSQQTDSFGLTSELSASMFPNLVIDLTPPTATVTPVTPSLRSTSLDQATISFSEPIASLSLNAMSLTRGSSGNLLIPAQSLTSTDGGLNWTLANLSPLTQLSGVYTLNLTIAGLTDLAGNAVSPTPTAGGSFTRTFTLVVHTPTHITLTPSSINETNLATSSPTLAGTLSTTDADVVDTFTYALVTGEGDDTDNHRFHIIGNQLFLNPGQLLDFESQSTYAIRLRTTDSLGNTLSRPFTVSLTDVNEAPTDLELVNVISSLPENASTASPIRLADLQVIDDALGSEVFTLLGTDAHHFEIVAGSLYLKSLTPLDFETQSSFTLRIEANDPTVGSTPDAFVDYTLMLTDVSESQPPVIAGFDTTITYRENGAPVLLDTNATVSDSDTTLFNLGQLTVTITDEARLADLLTIRNVGIGPNQIGVLGGDVTWAGVPFATWSGGEAGAPLVINFGSNATLSMIQGLIRNLQYANTSDAPSSPPVMVNLQLSDGQGGLSLPVSKTIQVTPINDAPELFNPLTSTNYVEDSPPVAIAPLAFLADVDSQDFSGGSLSLRVASNSQTTDRVRIMHEGTGPDQVGVEGFNVLFGGVQVGTWSGTTGLLIKWNELSTPTIARKVIQKIAFQNISSGMNNATRTVTMQALDGDGGRSLIATVTITMSPTNDAPEIQAFDTTVNYRENAAPVLLDSNAVVLDADNLDFASGQLVVELLGNDAEDRLSLRHQGTAANQVGLSGDTVTFGGVPIGTVSGGRIDDTPLHFVWNAQATAKGVQAVIRNLTFATTSDAPSNEVRILRLQMTDGDGGTSPFALKTLMVQGVNDAPTLTQFGGSRFFSFSNSSTLYVDDDVLVSDVDTPIFLNGRLSISVTTNAQSTDRLTFASVGNGTDELRVDGNQLFYEGSLIGTWTGTNRVVVTLNGNATQAAVQRLARSVLFSTISATPSLAPRTITMSLSDGLLTSPLVSKQIVNGAP